MLYCFNYFHEKAIQVTSCFLACQTLTHQDCKVHFHPRFGPCTGTGGLIMFKLFWVVSRPGPQASTSGALTWIQCKLGKQYLWKKVTLPWESNPEKMSIVKIWNGRLPQVPMLNRCIRSFICNPSSAAWGMPFLFNWIGLNFLEHWIPLFLFF